jgi:hypothetical protein
MSRRELGRVLAVAAAGATVAMCSAEAEEPTAEEKPDARTARVEQSVKWLADAWSKEPRFVVPDCTEPSFVFRPRPLAGKRSEVDG